MEIIIKKMNLADLNLIKNTLNSDFDDFWSYNTLKEEMSCKSSFLIVAKNQSNDIIGFAGLKIILDEADIMNIVVKKDCRGCGVGYSLMSNLIEVTKSLNIFNITLEVNENNSAALNLYKKLGFIEIGSRKKYYNNDDNAIIMNKKILK